MKKKEDNFDCRVEDIGGCCLDKYPKYVECIEKSCPSWGKCEECNWNSTARLRKKFCKNCIYKKEGKC